MNWIDDFGRGVKGDGIWAHFSLNMARGDQILSKPSEGEDTKKGKGIKYQTDPLWENEGVVYRWRNWQSQFETEV